jgi:hypothetical protein
MPTDDLAGIPHDTRLFRRIIPAWVVWDSNTGAPRPSSQAFQNSKDQNKMSVFAENVAIQHRETAEVFLKGRWSDVYLAAVPAGWMRENGQIVYLDPHDQEPDERYESHAAVHGPKRTAIRSKLAERYEWIVRPPNKDPR